MNPTSQDLLELLTDTKKQLEHLRILGVEGIKPIQTPPLQEAQVQEHEVRSSLFGDLAPAPAKLTRSTETFEQIHCEIGDCTRCPLHQERTHVVHTEGNRKARLM